MARMPCIRNYVLIMNYYDLWVHRSKRRYHRMQLFIHCLLLEKQSPRIGHLTLHRVLFSKFRIPEKVVEDNNPCGSKQLKPFAK